MTTSPSASAIPTAVGDGIDVARAAWSFAGSTPKHFYAHITRSVPNYDTGHRLVEQISDYFVKKDSVSYEIGTSTGVLIRRLASRHHQGARWIAIDVEKAMIDEALAEHARVDGPSNVEYVFADACDFDYAACDFIVAYYTVQFVAPRRRQQLVDALFRALNWGGALLLFEKVRAPDARFQDIASALYVDFKRENGYSPEEILGKADSLRGALEPFSTNGNLDILRRAGFVDIMTVYKHICFEGFLAIK